MALRLERAELESDLAKRAFMDMLGNPSDGDEVLGAIEALPAEYRDLISVQCIRVRHEIVARRLRARNSNI